MYMYTHMHVQCTNVHLIACTCTLFIVVCPNFLLGVWEYIETTRDMVRDLERRVRLAKGNVESIRTIMSKWSSSPLYQRKEDKKGSLLNLEVCNIEG